MDSKHSNRHLCLVKGKAGELPPTVAGPITRMGLRNHFQPISTELFAFAIFAKLALLGSILYFIYG